MKLLANIPAIVIPVAAGVVVLLVLIFVLRKIIIKKRGGAAEKTLSDRELVADNSAAVEALLVLAADNETLKGELKDLQEKLKYLIPSDDSRVMDYDRKIKNLIGDMRIALTKSDGEDSKKTENVLTDLKLAIADRNVRV